MGKSIEHYLDNPDDLDFTDPDAVAALADTGVMPDPEPPSDPEPKQPAPASAAEKGGEASDTGLDDGGKDADLEETKAPIQAKDGKHFLPYDVLEGTRKQVAEFKAQLEEQQAENERLRQLVEAKQTKGDDGGQQATGKVPETKEEAVLAEFVRKNGKTPDEFRAEYGDDLTRSFMAQAEDTVDLRDQLKTLVQDRQQRVETEEEAVARTVQESIDAIPALADVQANDPIRWKAAVVIDQALRDDPQFQNLTYVERFKEVAKRLGLPTENARPSGKTQQPSGTTDDDDGYPASLSDFPGGAPPAGSELESIDKIDVSDLGARFSDMSPKQMEAYLTNLY